MINLRSRGKTAQYAAYIDIGSGSVGGALVRMPHTSDEKPEIEYTYRYPISFDDDLSFDEYVEHILRAVIAVSQVIHQVHGKTPQRIRCFLAAPWYVAQTRTITYTKQTPFEVTQKLVSQLIEKDHQAFKTEHAESDSEAPFRVFEQYTIKSQLNGYVSNDPFGKKAKRLELTTRTAMAPARMLDAIITRIESALHTHTVSFHTTLSALYTTVRDLFAEVDDFILIDVSGEETEIAVVRDDVLMEQYSFSIGTHSVLRAIASAEGVSQAEARSLLNTVVAETGTEALKARIQPTLDYMQGAWVKEFQLALKEICCDVAIPASVFLLSGSETLDTWFTTVIKSEEFNQHMLTEKQYSVVPVTLRTLHGLCTYTDTRMQDPFVTLETIFSNRIEH